MKFAAISALLLCTAAPAFAQDAPADSADPTDGTVFDGDWLTVGVGAAYGPSYEGSDDNVVFPAPLAQGSVGGFDFGARGPGLYVDLIRDGDSDSNVKFIAGPLLRVRLDRHTKIKDPVVKLLGKRDIAVEVGATAGVSFSKVLNDYDLLTISSDIQWDVAGAHGGRLITPAVSYSTPLSKAIFTNLTVSATNVDGKYADYYYSVDPAGSLASGLPVFNAKGGWKSYGASLLAGFDLSGDITDGGWALFGLASYNRLTGDAKRSPVTSIRGDADQWLFAVGISYTF